MKSSERVHPRHVSGPLAIASLPGLRRRILVYRGDRSLRTEDDIDVWPVPRLLEALESGTLWP